MKKIGNTLLLVFLLVVIVVMSFQQPQRFLPIYLSVWVGTLIWIYVAFYRKRAGRKHAR
ncbi:hypothetical protein [Flaviaesturariibacter amylovorans]